MEKTRPRICRIRRQETIKVQSVNLFMATLRFIPAAMPGGKKKRLDLTKFASVGATSQERFKQESEDFYEAARMTEMGVKAMADGAEEQAGGREEHGGASPSGRPDWRELGLNGLVIIIIMIKHEINWKRPKTGLLIKSKLWAKWFRSSIWMFTEHNIRPDKLYW